MIVTLSPPLQFRTQLSLFGAYLVLKLLIIEENSSLDISLLSLTTETRVEKKYI